MTNNLREKANFIRQVADDILRDAFKAYEYGHTPLIFRMLPVFQKIVVDSEARKIYIISDQVTVQISVRRSPPSKEINVKRSTTMEMGSIETCRLCRGQQGVLFAECRGARSLMELESHGGFEPLLMPTKAICIFTECLS